ncbi:MAG TPA: hypothetical protein VGB71_11880, partial [Flavisolibacter sp.]
FLQFMHQSLQFVHEDSFWFTSHLHFCSPLLNYVPNDVSMNTLVTFCNSTTLLNKPHLYP